MSREASASLLRVEAIDCGYGKRQVLHGASIDVAFGEIVALIGHNGAGKSTLLKSLFGLAPIWSGRIILDGAEVGRPSPREMLKRGMAYVPQGSRVFGELTVQENMEVVCAASSDRPNSVKRIEAVLELVPSLTPRLRQRAGSLSGGEKQSLALANALLLSPRLLLLDEPSLGLDPISSRQAFNRIADLNRSLGTSVLMVEQKVRAVLEIAARVYVLRGGRVSFSGPSEALQDDAILRTVYL